jgi:hypothetical protein
VILLAGGLSAACGGRAPAAPDSHALALQPGLQSIQMTGFAISSDPLYPPCLPPGIPRAGTALWTTVMLAREGSEWVARSPPGLGDLEIRLWSDDRAGAGARQTVVGTMRGHGVDSERGFDVRVTVTGDTGGARFDGEKLSPYSGFIGGRLTGVIEFSDSTGAASTCTAVQFAIQPY